MNQNLKINITWDHIIAGVPCDYSRCAGSLSVKESTRATGSVKINGHCVYVQEKIGGKTKAYVLSRRLIKWITRFDEGHVVYPISGVAKYIGIRRMPKGGGVS